MNTEIILVLDRSTSMFSIQSSTIEGVNSFIRDQQAVEGHCNLTIHQFDNVHEVTHDAVPINQVDLLTAETFRPRGCTALLDAIGIAINTAKARFKEMSELDSPDLVMVAVMTDGEENSSHQYNMTQINDLISKQTDKYGWDFVFLAANQDAIATGANMGFAAGKSMTFAAGDLGMENTMASVSSYYAGARGVAGDQGAAGVVGMNFSDEDRLNAVKDD